MRTAADARARARCGRIHPIDMLAEGQSSLGILSYLERVSLDGLELMLTLKDDSTFENMDDIVRQQIQGQTFCQALSILNTTYLHFPTGTKCDEYVNHCQYHSARPSAVV